MTDTSRERIIVVGGVAAGMSAATRLRRGNETAQITVFECGDYVSFANCGLPYHVGGVISDRDALLLQTPEALKARFNIDARVGHDVTAIDRDARTVTVRTRDGQVGAHPYDALIIATGATAFTPPVAGIERALTLRSIEDLDATMAHLAAEPRPRTAVVMGAGYIGLEVAENLHHLGMDVTIVERAPQILSSLDVDMAAIAERHLRDLGVALELGHAVTHIDTATVRTDDGRHLDTDLVINATGVTPASAIARDAGLDIGASGGIVVDASGRTSDPHIYAAGDVAEKKDAITGDATLVPLAQTANRHGRLIADAICGRDVAAKPVLGTAIVGVFGLSVASTGLTERRLRDAGQAMRIIHTHPADHAGYYPGAQGMSLKLIVEPGTERILGAQAVGGNGVDKRIDVIATAMRGGLTAPDLADLELAYAPQFGSAKDPVNMLGMVADNLASGAIRTVQWHEVQDQVAAGAVLLDVRTADEVADGTLPGAMNIDVDTLRDRVGEIPDGPVLVFCAVGVRGNVATRLLTGLGRDAVNLDGGYRTWQVATDSARGGNR